jgi:subtilisin family serine protease
MKRVFLFGLMAVFLLVPVLPVIAGTIDPCLSDAVSTTEPGEKIGIIVVMKESFDVYSVWGDYVTVVTGLRATAQKSQAELLDHLLSSEGSGQVSDIKSFWIINAVAMKAIPVVIEEIAQRPDVDYITLEKERIIPPPIIEECIDAEGWNILKVRADEVWALGYDGSGMVVANIDTGVDVNHPALASKYRGGGNSWFDAVIGLPDPYDDHGHGTHTMGTMVGDDGGANQIGVAPGAKFIAAKAFDGEGTADDTWLIAAGQWVMDPDGNPETPDYPQVVNNSWGGAGCDPWYSAIVTNWRAAGIFPSFSAGNSGPGPGTVGSPGDYPESFATGATDSNDVIAGFSSRGPSCFGEIKPEVTAPGVSVRSSVPGGSYESWDGTSMAAPHVSGGVALLLQIDPATVTELENFLESTAVDLGSVGKDNDYGSGRIDLYEAALAAIAGPPLPPMDGPDLVVSQLSAPSSAIAGSSINVNNSVTNQGNQTAASSKAGFYLSSDNIPSIGPSDLFLGSRDVPKSDDRDWRRRRVKENDSVEASDLAPGETSADSTRLSIPSSTSEGTYYIKCMADYNGQVSETDEDNNFSASGPIAIQEGGVEPPPWWRRK